MKPIKFTAKFIKSRNEFEVFKNGEIFCHIYESDWDLFINSFNYKILTNYSEGMEVINEKI